MSRGNLELLSELVDAFKRRDLDAFLALIDDDLEATPPLASREGAAGRA